MAERTASQNCRLRTQSRLHRPEEFAAVMASRLRFQDGEFELRFRRHDTAEGHGRARLGLIVPKRLARRAVLRNLLKRLAREAFRHALPGLPPADIVVRLAKPPVWSAGGTRHDRRQEWRQCLDRLMTRLAGTPA